MKIIIIIIVLLMVALLFPRNTIENLTSSCTCPETVTSTDSTNTDASASGTVWYEETKPEWFDHNRGSTTPRSDLMVNNTSFTCIKGKDGCIDQIMTYDNRGLPKYNRTPNPSTQDFMIADKFHQKVRKKIINCPTGYSVSSSVNNLLC